MKRQSPAVTLPPLPWDHDAALARPDLEIGLVEVETGARNPATGAPVTERARVWRRETPPLVRALSEPLRLALDAYAAAVETAGSSTGTVDPGSAGGGSRSTPTGPSLARLTAARRVADMEAALAGHQVTLRHVPPLVLSYVDLLRLVAIDGLPATEIGRRAGIERLTRAQGARIGAAILDLAERLSYCEAAKGAPSRL